MKKTILLFTFCLLATLSFAQSPAKDTRFFETRIYYCETGRLDALLARFRNHSTKLLEKHGMTNIGYWVASDVPDKLVYIMAYPSREARDKSWEDFRADPEWTKVKEASEKDGKIVNRVESIFMNPTDFSLIK